MSYKWKDKVLPKEQRKEKIQIAVLSVLIIGAFIYAGMK